jgi:hypothetical protein
MKQTIRQFLLVEGIGFAAAGMLHAGRLIDGYAHRQAAIAESVIAGVLFAGWGLTWMWPWRTRSFGVAAQAFALLGTLIGIFTIAIGVGRRTVPDIAYHAAMVVVLGVGLVIGARTTTAD